jgi:taurine dioxygenase
MTMRTFQNIVVKPLSGSVGAEIEGVDLAKELPQQTFAEIHQAFLDHSVIFFRDQKITPEQQIAFVGRFGPVMHDPFMKAPEGRPEVMVVVKEKDEREVFAEGWHSDNTYLERPPLGSCLYALEVPPYGGDTLFASQYLAYEALSPGMKKMLDGMKAIHEPHGYASGILEGYYERNRAMKLRNDAVMDAALTLSTPQPVVRTHPETRRKALYVNAAYTVRFTDWTEEESRPVLQYLYAHCVQPRFTGRFRWTPGALALWDNRCVQHNPVNDYQGFRRVMHRVTAEGERPI